VRLAIHGGPTLTCWFPSSEGCGSVEAVLVGLPRPCVVHVSRLVQGIVDVDRLDQAGVTVHTLDKGFLLDDDVDIGEAPVARGQQIYAQLRGGAMPPDLRDTDTSLLVSQYCAFIRASIRRYFDHSLSDTEEARLHYYVTQVLPATLLDVMQEWKEGGEDAATRLAEALWAIPVILELLRTGGEQHYICRRQEFVILHALLYATDPVSMVLEGRACDAREQQPGSFWNRFWHVDDVIRHPITTLNGVVQVYCATNAQGDHITIAGETHTNENHRHRCLLSEGCVNVATLLVSASAPTYLILESAPLHMEGGLLMPAPDVPQSTLKALHDWLLFVKHERCVLRREGMCNVLSALYTNRLGHPVHVIASDYRHVLPPTNDWNTQLRDLVRRGRLPPMHEQELHHYITAYHMLRTASTSELGRGIITPARYQRDVAVAQEVMRFVFPSAEHFRQVVHRLLPDIVVFLVLLQRDADAIPNTRLHKLRRRVRVLYRHYFHQNPDIDRELGQLWRHDPSRMHELPQIVHLASLLDVFAAFLLLYMPRPPESLVHVVCGNAHLEPIRKLLETVGHAQPLLLAAVGRGWEQCVDLNPHT
jgi:hypothetical protein